MLARSRLHVDLGGHTMTDFGNDAALWPAAPQPVGAYAGGYGLDVFSSRSDYRAPLDVEIGDSSGRLLMTVWSGAGPLLDLGGRLQQVAAGQVVGGHLDQAPIRARFHGCNHHVGLVVSDELLCRLAGDAGERFLRQIGDGATARISTASPRLMRLAGELDRLLLQPSPSQLRCEAASLDLLATWIEDEPPATASIPPAERERLEQARQRLLADLARPPTIVELARDCGLNTLKLKRGFKLLFGLPVHAFYQRERMQLAWELIASGRANAGQAGGMVGYDNLSHFGAAFRRQFGILPGQLRRQR